MRNMAYAVTVKNIKKIEGKDRIVYATFNENAYGTIVSNTYKVGDVVVYFEVDSILPQEDRFEFLRKRCFNERLNGFLIKPMKMAKFYSFGLTMTFDELNIKPVPANTDLTDTLKVRKNEAVSDKSPVENKSSLFKFCMKYKWLRPFAKFFIKTKEYVNFPVECISKSDEENLYNHTDWFDKFHNDKSYMTIKMEGQSVTILFKKKKFKNNFYVFGRNTLASHECTEFMQQYKEKLERLNTVNNTSYAIQGEFCSPKVQSGIYKNGIHFYVYRIRDISQQKDLCLEDMLYICKEFGFEFVPLIEDKQLSDFKSIDELFQYVEKLYFSEGDVYKIKHTRTKNAVGVWHHEGIVVRNLDQTWSFKVKSKEYQLDWANRK